METTNTEQNAVSKQLKVLSIGDKVEDTIEKIEPLKFCRKDFTAYQRYLLLGTREPVEIVQDWNLIQTFGASVHMENNVPKSYSFYYNNDRSRTSESIIDGPTSSGKKVLAKVRRRLSKENWISENEISTPIQENLERYYQNQVHFIQRIVLEALDTEKTQLFHYFLFLHRENVKQKK